jgi:hypothetical protein
LAPSRTEDRKVSGKRRAGNANKKRGEITTSPLPGTTLEFIKVDLGDGRNLYDTPGLLVPGTLTQILTPDELKVVVPRKYVRVRLGTLLPELCSPCLSPSPRADSLGRSSR